MDLTDDNKELYNSKLLSGIESMKNISHNKSQKKNGKENGCGEKKIENIQNNVESYVRIPEIHENTIEGGNIDKNVGSSNIEGNSEIIQKGNVESYVTNPKIHENVIEEGNTDINIELSNIGDKLTNIGGNSKVTLHQACTQGNYDLVKSIIISPNVDVNMVDKEGWSCLHETCIHSCQFTEIAELLLKNGANPNLRDNSGETPLHGAVMFHFIENVKLLFNYKADFNLCNNKGISPLHIADSVKDSEILTLFGVPLKERAVKKASKYGTRKKWKRPKNITNIVYHPSPLLSPSILKTRKRISDENEGDFPTPKKNISFSL